MYIYKHRAYHASKTAHYCTLKIYLSIYCNKYVNVKENTFSKHGGVGEVL